MLTFSSSLPHLILLFRSVPEFNSIWNTVLLHCLPKLANYLWKFLLGCPQLALFIQWKTCSSTIFILNDRQRNPYCLNGNLKYNSRYLI